jgi:hypothetical protein
MLTSGQITYGQLCEHYEGKNPYSLTNMDHALDWDPITKSWGGNNFDSFLNKVGDGDPKHILQTLFEADPATIGILMHKCGLLGGTESSSDTAYDYDPIKKSFGGH